MNDEMEKLATAYCTQKYHFIHIGNDDLWGASKAAFKAGYEAAMKEMASKQVRPVGNYLADRLTADAREGGFPCKK